MGSELLSYEQAASIIAQHARSLAENLRRPTERIELSAASGRILAAAIRADDDQPPFPRSTRDGYACRTTEISGRVPLPVVGSTHAGEAPASALRDGAAWEIMTGAAVPDGADCVVMLEHVEKIGETICLHAGRAISAGDNIVAKGAQAERGQELMSAGISLGPAQIALAASCGYAHVDVYARPRVAILATGDELVPIEETPGPGKIRNSNASMLAALVAGAGGEPVVLPAALDTAEALQKALAQAADADMLLITGGVSAGRYDLVEPALAKCGATFHFTGVEIQPGKPLVFGEMPGNSNRTIPFFGLPGNPISSAATFMLFAAHVLAAICGSADPVPRFVLATLVRDTDRKGKPGLTRFLPARCAFSASVSRPPAVAIVPWHGSGDLTAFAQSNCFLVVPENEGFLTAGSIVRILLH